MEKESEMNPQSVSLLTGQGGLLLLLGLVLGAVNVFSYSLYNRVFNLVLEKAGEG